MAGRVLWSVAQGQSVETSEERKVRVLPRPHVYQADLSGFSPHVASQLTCIGLGVGIRPAPTAETLAGVPSPHPHLRSDHDGATEQVERAKGAAEARKTEGLGMTAEQYIQYLWVKKLDLSQSKTIYLPTEGGLPKVTMEVEK